MPAQTYTAFPLSGVVDITCIETVHESLRAAIAGGAVEIDLAGVTELDLTLIQLIESARRSAAASGTGLRLAAPAQGAVLQTLERGGFLAGAAAEATDFWRGR